VNTEVQCEWEYRYMRQSVHNLQSSELRHRSPGGIYERSERTYCILLYSANRGGMFWQSSVTTFQNALCLKMKI